MRTPLDELETRITETITRQGGDDTANQCVIDAVLAAYDNDELTPIDLDEYARAGNITQPMLDFLQQLQNNETCTTN